MRRGSCASGGGFAEQEEDDCEEGDELEEDEGGGHSIFLRPQDITGPCGGFAVGESEKMREHCWKVASKIYEHVQKC